MLPEVVIHFGATEYKPAMVQPIKNRNWMKPFGGLWTSPINSKYGWREWCKAEDFEVYRLENSFKLLFNPDVKIFTIDTLQDLEKTPLEKVEIGKFKREYPDFELLAKTYDAIWLTERGQYETRYSQPANLYGWDCETVLIMNPQCCTQLIN